MKLKQFTYIKFLCTMLLMFVSTFFVMTVQADVSFDVYQYDIIADIVSDGDVNFQETIYYDVDNMNGALFNLDYGSSEFTNYRVGIKNLETNNITYLTENATGDSGTYYVNNEDGKMKFKVYYPVHNDKVAFVYEYTLESLVINYLDTAQFNRKVVGSHTDDRMNVNVRVNLPSTVTNKEDFRAWAHGALNGTISLGNTANFDFIEAQVINNPPNQFVEINAIFPVSLTPNNTNIIAENKKEAIMAMESELAAQNETSSRWRKIQSWLVSLLLFILLPIVPVWGLVRYITSRKKLNPHPVKLPHHIYHLPEDLTPAVMASAVLRYEPNEDDFTATIVDLARKGYLILEEVPKAKRSFVSSEKTTVKITLKAEESDKSTLQRHEIAAMNFLYPNGWDKTPFTLEEFNQTIKVSKAMQRQQYKYYNQFITIASVRGEQVSKRPSDVRMSIDWMSTVGIVVSLVLIAASLYFANEGILVNQLSTVYIVIGIVMVAMSIITLLLNRFLPVRSEKEDKMRQEWHGFKNMLEDIGNMKMRDIASLELWESYLVYAISLGVADKVIETMHIQFNDVEMSEQPFMRSVYYHPYMISDLLRHDLSTTVQNVIPKESSSSSNSSGFGGGFSAGSSGGSGGGSGVGGF